MPEQLELLGLMQREQMNETNRLRDNSLLAGVDEVGRGALFGPVVAAAVILQPCHSQRLMDLGVTDSKKLTPAKREALVEEIKQAAIDCQIGLASVWEIDRINILQASLLAMKRAISRLQPAPDVCLIDGNQLVPNLAIPQEAWIKGDQRSIAIASASILAKVWRDRLIVRLSTRYPHYHLAQNKGYGSAAHRQALLAYGASKQHRRSFKPCQ
ncbi:MAG: ribonuclease HII [Thainema sp.]